MKTHMFLDFKTAALSLVCRTKWLDLSARPIQYR